MLLDASEVAKRLGRSRSWFYDHQKELDAAGFPRPLPVVDRWDPAAIDAWLAAQRGLAAAACKDEARRARRAAFGL